MHRTHAPTHDAGPSTPLRATPLRATTVRALTGLLLGAAAGAVAALVAPRRSTTAGDEEGPVPLPS